jgi:hypothetical protein
LEVGAKSFPKITMILSMSSLVVDMVARRVADSGGKPSSHLSKGPGFGRESL